MRRSAAAGSRIDIFLDNAVLERFDDPAGSISDPATSPAALAVGAVCFQTGAIEPYSGRGPTIDGRTKPDIAAPDAVTTATYGRSDACAGGGFAGTSAAAPHVAGAAALALQGSPRRTIGVVRQLLRARAADRGATGVDDDYGSGSLALGAPLSLLDVKVPSATALPARGRAGRTLHLRFRSRDPDSRSCGSPPGSCATAAW